MKGVEVMGMSHEGPRRGKDGVRDGRSRVWSLGFGDDSEPVCVNWSVKSGSLIKLLFFFGKQIQQGEFGIAGVEPVVDWELVGLDGGRRMMMDGTLNLEIKKIPTKSDGDYSRSCSVECRIALIPGQGIGEE